MRQHATQTDMDGQLIARRGSSSSTLHQTAVPQAERRPPRLQGPRADRRAVAERVAHPGSAHAPRSGRCSASFTARRAAGSGRAPTSASSSAGSPRRRGSGAASHRTSCATRTPSNSHARTCRSTSSSATSATPTSARPRSTCRASTVRRPSTKAPASASKRSFVAYESGLVRPTTPFLALRFDPDAGRPLAGLVQDDLRGNGAPACVSDR
jgi:hypothetical protein